MSNKKNTTKADNDAKNDEYQTDKAAENAREAAENAASEVLQGARRKKLTAPPNSGGKTFDTVSEAIEFMDVYFPEETSELRSAETEIILTEGRPFSPVGGVDGNRETFSKMVTEQVKTSGAVVKRSDGSLVFIDRFPSRFSIKTPAYRTWHIVSFDVDGESTTDILLGLANSLYNARRDDPDNASNIDLFAQSLLVSFRNSVKGYRARSFAGKLIDFLKLGKLRDRATPASAAETVAIADDF